MSGLPGISTRKLQRTEEFLTVKQRNLVNRLFRVPRNYYFLLWGLKVRKGFFYLETKNETTVIKSVLPFPSCQLLGVALTTRLPPSFSVRYECSLFPVSVHLLVSFPVHHHRPVPSLLHGNDTDYVGVISYSKDFFHRHNLSR